MEEGQKVHITENLPDLLECTSVEVALLVQLQSRGILSAGDKEKLQLAGQTNSEKADLLYSTVMRKHNAYQSLKEALSETGNSGAAIILGDYCYREYAFPYEKVIICYEDGTHRQRVDTIWQFISGKFEERDITVKKCSLDRVNTKRVWAEVELLMKLDWHDNIVRYFKTEMSNNCILVALEYYKTNLTDWLTRSSKPFRIDVDGAEILKQALDGIGYLHKEKTIHGNLNPNNILLTNPDRNIFRVKISDFALSSMLLDSKKKKEIFPTEFRPMGWSAPEVVIGFEEKNPRPNGQNTVLTSFAADVFSLGCIFHFVLTNGDHHLFGKDMVRNTRIMDGKRADMADINFQISQSNQDIRYAELIGRMTENSELERPLASAIQSEQALWTSV